MAVLDLNEELLEREGAALRASGARIFTRAVDVADRAAIEAAYKAIRGELGSISIVVANAGYSEHADIQTMPLDIWKRMIDVNLTGAFHTIQAALSDMVALNWGRIVTSSSQAAQSGAQDRADYAAAKAGVIGFTRSLARELARHGITANTIPPSLVATPALVAGLQGEGLPPLEMMVQGIPILRAGTPKDIAGAVEYLCSDNASYVTGQEINVNGGSWM